MANVNSFAWTGGDCRQASGGPSRCRGGQQFIWSALSPSPAEIAGLELQFLNIIQLPSEAIDLEIKEWLAGGLIVRSLSRWVPSEAVVWEFRRAGLAICISSINLSHRIALMKFEAPAAKDAAMLQPWVVNGQPLAAEPWRPYFVPADNALTSALLWICLPNLPIEYWFEDALRSILAVAGEFVAADSSTKDRRRGGFARAAVRVYLSRPLRPGARIKGNGSPFWQQFAYEHVEGICPHCGSLHLANLCSSSMTSSSSSASPQFGP